MWPRWIAITLVIAGLVGHPGGRVAPVGGALAQGAIPQTEGWVLVVSRCVICHSVEVAVQQRQGPQGWGAILDRMARYGMPMDPDERQVLVTYLVRHFGDTDGR